MIRRMSKTIVNHSIMFYFWAKSHRNEIFIAKTSAESLLFIGVNAQNLIKRKD